MKRISCLSFAFILILALYLSFTACFGPSDDDDNDDNNDNNDTSGDDDIDDDDSEVDDDNTTLTDDDDTMSPDDDDTTPSDDDDTTPPDDDDDDDNDDNDDNNDDNDTEGWIDPSTNLMWQKEPAPNEMDWEDAITYCNALSLGNATDWRLPSISELRSLVRGCPGTQSAGTCGVKDNCLSVADCRDGTCNGCDENQGPNNGIYWPDDIEGTGNPQHQYYEWYWSSSTVSDQTSWAWGIDFPWAWVGHNGKDNDACQVRCVRDAK